LQNERITLLGLTARGFRCFAEKTSTPAISSGLDAGVTIR